MTELQNKDYSTEYRASKNYILLEPYAKFSKRRVINIDVFLLQKKGTFMNRQQEIVSEAIKLCNFVTKTNLEIFKAGGSGFDIETLDKMTAAEFFTFLYPNNLKIIYSKD